MNTIFLNELIVWLRLPPLFLFLIQYRGKPWAPIAMMLRGFVVAVILQALTAMVALVLSKSISPVALVLAVLSHGAFLIWPWAFYFIYRKYRTVV